MYTYVSNCMNTYLCNYWYTFKPQTEGSELDHLWGFNQSERIYSKLLMTKIDLT